MKRSLTRSSLVAAFVALATACGGEAPPPIGNACDTDDECPAGLVCSGGSCAAPRDAGAPLGAPEIEIFPTTLDFGSPQLGVAAVQQLTVRNLGDATLTLTRIEVVEADSLDEFSAAPTGLVSIAIAPGESLVISATLVQQDAELDRGELRLSSDDADEPILPVTLLAELKGTPVVVAEPDVVAFGVVTWGELPSRDVDVRNAGTGNAPLVVSTVEVTDETGAGGAYSVEPLLVDPATGAETPTSLPVLLSPGQSTLRARVTLASGGLPAGPLPAESLRIISDDADPRDAELLLPIVGSIIGCAAPATETCNGLDDDCDGTPDDGDPGAGAPCTAALPGVCASGTLHCEAGALACSSAVTPSPETCDNEDDDCDGVIDEDLLRVCTTACGSGIEVCVTGGWYGCNAPTGGPERCDGVDNDCNPATADGADEFFLGAPCDGADGDLCVEGVTACGAGFLGCSDSTATTTDLCNGLDDDCNPSTTDGSAEPVLGASCDGADTDLCAEGTRACTAGVLACNDAPGPALDLCNGDDDDCNAVTPDGSGDPLVGAPCDGADGDLCIEGVFACAGGTLACTDASATTTDLCNGDDDDCNSGTSDGSGESVLGAPCDGADADLCADGATICVAGTLGCADSLASALDLCNGVDDDCDPATLDGSADPRTGGPCDGVDGDVCAEGLYDCTAGVMTCSDATATTAETCDGRDEDCDSVIDDGGGALCALPPDVAATACGGLA
ncbi:MAG: choice-of-anchor D domain-containing protein, partial [Myxococcales bacterium]|nr:choice-of-anchor D domain-containing protein [Myxococcales bacterium]